MSANITVFNIATNHKVPEHGWISSPDGRGTWDILWSCLVTISLCCWASICPNIPARTDSRWKRFRDKLGMAGIGILGPEFLLMLALGQWTSARRSVKKFQDAGYMDWTLTHAFFADMGGFLLQSPDFPDFPLDSEQLHYLVTKKYIEYPNVDIEEIEDKNKSDGLARVITVCQVVWFAVTSIARPIQGLFLTTLELTTLSFIAVFLAVSYCWLNKPMDVSKAFTIQVETKIEVIMQQAGAAGLEPWSHTPLEFINRSEWFCSIMWRYYTQILVNMRMPLFRPVTTRPYNRIPSDNFPPTDPVAEIICAPFILFFCCTFMCAWNFSFPTSVERIMWRVASVYTLTFGLGGGIYSLLCHKILLPRLQDQKKRLLANELEKGHPEDWRSRLHKIAEKLRNNSPGQDRKLETPLKVLIPVTIMCAIYCLCRMYVLVEDFVGLRKLPSSAFGTVGWSSYLPHL